jgi:hypothetical protein
MILVVLAEEIGPEIIFAVAPDGMDVIGAVLDIVVLKNESGALNSIIVRFTRFKAACPCEMDVLRSGRLQFPDIRLGQFGSVIANVGFNQLTQVDLLLEGHLSHGQSFRFKPTGGTSWIEDDIGRSGSGQQRYAALPFIKGGDQAPGEIFLAGHDAESGAGSGRNGRGIGTEEGRGDCDRLTFDDGEIEGKMVAIEPPAPGSVGAGSPKDTEVIEAGIAKRAASGFKDAQDFLKADDGGGLEKALGAQGCAEKRVSQGLLMESEIFEGYALSSPRDVMPVLSFRILEIELGLGPLRGGESVEESLGSISHWIVGGVGVKRNNKPQEERKCERSAMHGREHSTTPRGRGKQRVEVAGEVLGGASCTLRNG